MRDPYAEIPPERRRHIDALSMYATDGPLMWHPPEPMTMVERFLRRKKWLLADTRRKLAEQAKPVKKPEGQP